MKILIIYATAGAGHRRAAEAIFNAAIKEDNLQATVIDSLDYTNLIFRKIYSVGYHILISKLPWIWAVLYYMLDNPIIYRLTYSLRKLIVYLNSKPLVNYINKEKPDIIISTQFFANEIINLVKKQGLINPRLFCVVTDFGLHSFWLSSAVDLYLVGSETTKKDLVSRGIKEEKIKILGIPVDSKFLDSLNKNELCVKFGIRPDKFTALIMTGAIGIGPIEKIVERLRKDIQLLVVCGKNKGLYGRLKQKETDMLKIFGLVDNVHELMSVSDIIITKPGGLSISESLIKNLPMIFISAIPGQESRNAKFIIDEGLGVTSSNVDSLIDIVYRWKNSPDILEEIKDKIKKISSPNAAREILKIAQ